MSVEVQQSTEVPKVKGYLLFIGRRYNPKEKQYWMWQKIKLSQNNGYPLGDLYKDAFFLGGKKIIPGVAPGAIVEVAFDAEKQKTVFYGEAKIIDYWKNQEDREMWAFHHETVERQIEAKGKVLTKLKGDLPMASLEPFRRAYFNAENARQQAHVLAMVIQEITSYKKYSSKDGHDD